MKYFTPDLLARCRSLDDDVAEAAAEEWERTSAAYAARLKAIRSSLPRDVRSLLATTSLHDAKLLSLSFGKRERRFFLRVRLEGTGEQPGDVLELRYHPVAGPNGGVALRKHSDSGSATPGSYWVLCSEFDADEERGFFTHSLLLTGGVELEVRFHSVSIQRLEEVASPLELGEVGRTWPLVGA